MSSSFNAGEGASGARRSPRSDSPSSRPTKSSRTPFRPRYFQYGTGSLGHAADALMAELDRDSGYGSMSNGDGDWHRGSEIDLPTPPLRLGDTSAEAEDSRRMIASQIHQRYFNKNRAALGRAINRTIVTLKELQQMNSKWPAHYPSIKPELDPSPSKSDPRPGMHHTQSSVGDWSYSAEKASRRPGPPQRAGTSVGEDYTAESSKALVKREDQGPEKLITPQAAHDFSVLKLDLKLQGLTQSEIAHSMDRRAIASLLDGKIRGSIRHLELLKGRIEDVSSKVLVTGDLNAGKSTFCNALLRRKVLPEDQQPCTSIFCEVLDARQNGGIEEVHAVHKDQIYNLNDESTFDVFSISDLENIVTTNEFYDQCKVYIQDSRIKEESLLRNGVVNITLIDAPGLNSDSLKTTAVFARQEEIDVVVFVVSAANRFTLSAKDFLAAAANEKAYLFIVVNGFDNIRDKDRCKNAVMEQVMDISRTTFKDSSDLVHFVSSNVVPVAPGIPSGGPDGNNGGSTGGGSGFPPSGDLPPDDDDDDGAIVKDGDPGYPSAKGESKGKEKEQLQDFEKLESSLRNFVLEKRARSKLAPAKTYLLNILSDLHSLATTNHEIAESELDRVIRELSSIEPAYEESRKAKSEVSENIDSTIDITCTEIYNHTRSAINTTIAQVGEGDLGVQYPGLFGAFSYAEDIKAAILEQISATIALCEDNARTRTVDGVSTIQSLGQLHLGEKYQDLNFRSDMMFRKKRHVIAKDVHTQVEVWDFFDVSTVWERQEKVLGGGMAMTVVGVLGGRLVGGVGWLDGALGMVKVVGPHNVRRMIVPGIIGAAVLTASYLLSLIPQTLPRKLSSRISSSLAAIDYTHLNAHRISSEVRQILRYPAEALRVGLQHSVESLSKQRDESLRTKKESEVARKYFVNLVRESDESKNNVEAVDLEGTAPGLASEFEPGIMV